MNREKLNLFYYGCFVGHVSIGLGCEHGDGTRRCNIVQGIAEVYQLISENEHFRVIMATWKPGQRDAWHSHAGPLAGYRLTDCKLRSYTPDGKSQERVAKRGEVLYNPVIASHSVENIGATDCQVPIVEKK